MAEQLLVKNARDMTDAEAKKALADILRANAAAADGRRHAAVMDGLRKRYPDLARAADQAAAEINMATYRGLLKQQISAELAMQEAAKISEAAKASPSQLERQRAADGLAAAVQLRDSLTTQTERAHAQAYALPGGA